MEESGHKNIYVDAHVEPIKGSKIKRGTRVQFVNQDLNEAIKEMKQSIRNKSKTNLHGYSTNNSERNLRREFNNPENTERNGSDSRILFTETYKKKVQQRISQIEERKKQLTAQSLEKQMRARLLRKIEENVKLKEKMDILKEIQERRQLLLTEKFQKEKRKKQQQQLLHHSSRVNAEMSRKTRKKTIKSELKDSRCIQQESLREHKFKNYLSQKQKQEKNVLLHYRHQFLIRNKSSQGLRDSILTSRTRTLSRAIKTSHVSTKNKERTLDEDEKMIIQQYKSREEGQIGSAKGETKKSQKKYNLKVRRSSKVNENNEQEKPDENESLIEENHQQKQ